MGSVLSFTLAEARREAKRSLIREVYAVRVQPGSWVVDFTVESPGVVAGEHGHLVDARSGDVRFFKSLDAIVNTIDSMGIPLDRVTFRDVSKADGKAGA